MTIPPRRKPRRWGYDSRGTPAVLMLPGCLALILLAILPLLAPDLLQRCIGRTIEPPRGKAGILYLAIETACAPLLFLGPGKEILLAITLVALLLASLWARRWTKAHQAHWDVIRAREHERRAEKRRNAERGPG
jgi:hypothetical protein